MIRTLLNWLSIRHWLRHPVRMLLTLLGISLGVAVTIAVDLLGTEILAANRRSIEAIAGKAQLTVSHGTAGMERTIADKLLQMPGVAHVDPMLEIQLMEPGHGPVLLLGVDFLGDKTMRQLEAVPDDSAIIQDPIAFLNSTSAALVPKNFAARRHLKKGDSISLTTPIGQLPFVIKGLMEDRGPARAFNGDVLVMYLDAAQVALKMGDRITRVDLGLKSEADPATVRESITAALGPGYTVDYPASRGARLDSLMASLKQALSTMAALAIWVGILLAYNAMDISVRQRKNELAILRAIGSERKTLLILVLTEALAMGALATVVGLFLGYVLAQQGLGSTSATVNAIYAVVKVDEVTIGPRQIITALFVGLIIPLIGALLPALWIAKQSPVVGLTRSNEEVMVNRGKSRSVPRGIGMVLLGVLIFMLPAGRSILALAFLAFYCVLGGAMLLAPTVISSVATLIHRFKGHSLGAEWVIGLDHVVRDRRRSALNIASLVASVATVVTVAFYVTSFYDTNMRWIAASQPADLFVVSGAKLAIAQNIPLDPNFGEELVKVPGVSEMFRARLLNSEYKGGPIKIIAYENIEGYRQHAPWIVLDGKMTRGGPTDQGRGVMINEALAHRAKLWAGNQIVLDTPSGPQPYLIESVVVDFMSDQGVVVMDRAPFLRQFRDELVDCFDLFLKPGVDPKQVQSQILKDYGQRYNLFVLTNAEIKAETQQLINQIFALLNLLQLVTIIIAVLGVSTTLGAAVLDRTQEVGVMRAVGCSPGQIIRIVLIEAGFLGFTATVFGIVVGTLSGYMFMRSVLIVAMGWTLPWLFPLAPLVGILFGVTTASILAGLYPAWWSSRQPTLESLRTE